MAWRLPGLQPSTVQGVHGHPPSPQGRGQVALGLELGLEKAAGLWAASGHVGQDVPAPSQCAAYDWLFWFSFITDFINPDIIPFCIFKIGE
jgi:hypothetical protein